jgi:hypothetical protein
LRETGIDKRTLLKNGSYIRCEVVAQDKDHEFSDYGDELSGSINARNFMANIRRRLYSMEFDSCSSMTLLSIAGQYLNCGVGDECFIF